MLHVTAKHTHTNTRTHTHTHIFRTALQPVSAALPRTTVVTPTLARTFGIVKLLHEDRRRARGTAMPGERVGRDVATRDSGGRHSSAPPRRRHMLPHRRGTPAAARRRTDAEQSRGQRQRDTVRGHAGTRGGAPYPASPIAYSRLASSNIAPSCVEATPKAENGLTHEPCRGSCPISATGRYVLLPSAAAGVSRATPDPLFPPPLPRTTPRPSSMFADIVRFVQLDDIGDAVPQGVGSPGKLDATKFAVGACPPARPPARVRSGRCSAHAYASACLGRAHSRGRAHSITSAVLRSRCLCFSRAVGRSVGLVQRRRLWRTRQVHHGRGRDGLPEPVRLLCGARHRPAVVRLGGERNRLAGVLLRCLHLLPREVLRLLPALLAGWRAG